MPYVKFVKHYPGYTVGQVVDLPGKLSYQLRDLGVVVKFDPNAPAPVAKKAAKKATKKAR